MIDTEPLLKLIGHCSPKGRRREVFACYNMSLVRANTMARTDDAYFIATEVSSNTFSNAKKKIYAFGHGAIESVQKLATFEAVSDGKAQRDDLVIETLCGGCNLDVSKCLGGYLSCVSGEWSKGREVDREVSQEAWDALKEADRRLQAPYPDDVAEAGW